MEMKPVSWFKKAFIAIRANVKFFFWLNIVIVLAPVVTFILFDLKGRGLIIGYAVMMTACLLINYAFLHVFIWERFGPIDALDLQINKAKTYDRK